MALELPLTVVTPADLSRLLREVEDVDDFLHQSQIRTGGTPVTLPRFSRGLEDICRQNSLNLLDKDNREKLIDVLRKLKTIAPKVHMSFPTEPTGSFTSGIIGYLRREIHPYIVLQIGVQPNLAIGSTLRTRSKYFDFSLRKHLESQKSALLQMLHEASGAQGGAL
jgi:hypothetical protein